MKKIFLMLLISFLFINSSALSYGGCDYSEVSRMKSILKNINISYDYTIVNNEAHFSVTINNLTDDIYFYDSVTKRNYYYGDSNNGEITINDYMVESGNYKFYSNKQDCYGISLGTKYYIFPKYNKFFSNPLCSDIPNYSLCQKWVPVDYSLDEFEKLVNEYKNKKQDVIEDDIQIQYEKNIVDKLAEIYVNNYYYFFGGLIVVCLIIIGINNKKNKFKL